MGAWVDGKLVKVADVTTRKWRIISDGPVRSIAELTYEGWRVGGQSITFRSRIVQWAGDRGFFHSIVADGAEDMTFATALPSKPAVTMSRSEANAPSVWLATYGEQVVHPGPTATEELKGTNLGLVLIFRGSSATFSQDALNYLLTFSPQKNGASWYVAAAWDEEGMNNHLTIGKSCSCSWPFAPPPLKTKAAFLGWIDEKSSQLANPAVIKVLTSQ